MTPEDSKKKENKLKEECFQRNKCQGWLMMDLGGRTTVLKASQWGEEWGWLTDQGTQAFGRQLPAGSDTPGFPLSAWATPTDCEEWSDPWHGAARRKRARATGSPPNGGRWLSHTVAPRSGEFWWPRQQHLPPPYLMMWRNSGSST